jgi:hypothetical protein
MLASYRQVGPHSQCCARERVPVHARVRRASYRLTFSILDRERDTTTPIMLNNYTFTGDADALAGAFSILSSMSLTLRR